MTIVGRRVRLPWTLLVCPFLGWIVLILVGYWPTRVYTEGRGIESMLAAQILVLAAVYVTLVPAMMAMAGADASGRTKIGFKAAAIRFLFTVLVAGLIAWRGQVDREAFLAWVAIAYVLMIKVETLVLVRWSKLVEKARCS
jgi:hypothetical protein